MGNTKLSKAFNRILSKFNKLRERYFFNEGQYYTNLFTKNNIWNNPKANYEEQLRWEIIEDFVKLILKLNKNITLSILDLGCGRGWLTNLLSSYGEIIGVEPVRKVVQYANKIFPKLTIINGDVSYLSSRDYKNKFNLIVLSEVIEHIPDKEKSCLILEISELLSSNGYFIITTPRKECQEIWSAYSDPDQPIEDWMTENQLEHLVISNGFKTIDKRNFSISPKENAPLIEIYQLWLFQKNNLNI